MDADGSDRKRLALGSWPTWSPDGDRISYTAGNRGNEKIYVMKLATRRKRVNRIGTSFIASTTWP